MKDAPLRKSEELQSLFDECKSINVKLHASIKELLHYSKELCEDCDEIEVEFIDELDPDNHNSFKTEVKKDDRNLSQANSKN